MIEIRLAYKDAEKVVIEVRLPMVEDGIGVVMMPEEGWFHVSDEYGADGHKVSIYHKRFFINQAKA